MLVVRHPQMELPGWPSELRIAVLSDLHIGSPHVGLDKLRRIVEKTNAENPSLVVLLGDFVIGGPNHRGGVRGGGFIDPALAKLGNTDKVTIAGGIYAPFFMNSLTRVVLLAH